MRFYEALASTVTRRSRAKAAASNPDTQVSTDATDTERELAGNSLLSGSAWKYVWDAASIALAREKKYAEYDEMDRELPEYSAALDIYADNATRGDSGGDPEVTVRAEDPKVQRELDALLKRIDIVRIIWSLARDLVKYGERAEEVVVDSNYDIVRLKPLRTQSIVPNKDKWGRFKKAAAWLHIDDAGKVVTKFKEWQVLYIANKKGRSDRFGTGLGYSVRRVFKLLRMMEEALVVARLTRAHNRFAFIIGVEGMTAEEKKSHLKKIIRGLKKPSMMDPRAGRIDPERNPLNVEQDLFLSSTREAPSDVKVLQGDLTVGNLEDVQYFLQKVLSGLKTPKAYLAHERDTKARAVITEQDIQFARSVRRYQFLIQEALRDLCDFQLRLKGIDPANVEYSISLPTISTIDELRLWQTEQLRQLSARMFKTNFWAADEWILRDYLKLPEEKVKDILAGQNAPDEFNGLQGQAKVGAVADNSGVSESFAAALEAFEALDVDGFDDAMRQLRDQLQ